MNGPTFKTLSDVKATKIRWLWKPYIPYGLLSILEGDPDVGKSFVAMHLAVVVTTGGKLPDGSNATKGNVLYVSSEDDAGSIIRPRIEKMGGDLSKIRILDGLLTFNEDGLNAIQEEVEDFEPDLVIFDTLFSFMPDGVDLSRPSAVRAQLHAIQDVFRECGAAVVLIRHWTKMSKGKALYRGTGLMDFGGVARSVLAAARHPEEPDLRVLASVKLNIERRGPSYLYELVGEKNEMPRLVWRGTTHLTADDLEGGIPASVRPIAGAHEFIKEQLKDGPKLATVVFASAEKRSFSKRTIERAKSELDIVSEKRKNGWTWRLPH